MKTIEGRQASKVDHYIMAHSGGSQAVIRSLYLIPPTNATGILLANAGSWLFPTRDLNFPYGLGGLEKNDEALKAFLSLPLVICLGTGDIHDGNNFDNSAGAMAQGPSRLDRGRAMVAIGHRVAESHGWKCSWTLVEVPGVGHDGGAMLNYEKVGPALFGEEKYEYYTSAAEGYARNNNITHAAVKHSHKEGGKKNVVETEVIEADGKHHPHRHAHEEGGEEAAGHGQHREGRKKKA